MVNPIKIEVPHENRNDYGLTGNTRLRIHKINKMFSEPKLLVVLQVEEKWRDGDTDWRGLPSYIAGVGWRDATPDDLINVSVLNSCKE